MSRKLGWLVWVVGWLAVGCGGGAMGSLGADSPGFEGDGTPPPRDGQGVAATVGDAPPGPLGQADWSSSVAVRGPLEVLTEPGELPYLQQADEGRSRLPLEHTRVRAQLMGFVAQVEVTQTYQNPSNTPIEAQYVFPLPENSAVHHMHMVIGTRQIVARIEERQRARQIYETAKRSGHTAALLEQERPNVFTQSVANIEPGKRIQVVLRYVQDLSYDAGRYEFVFPMVVGPRFMPGDKLAGSQAGSGTHADTHRVPDASRISPPILGRGERSGHDISVEVVADSTMTVGDVEVPTHEVVRSRGQDGSFQLQLADKKELPNRDFVMRYRVAGPEPKATLFASADPAGGGYFSLVVHPPALDVEELVGRREIIFVVDVSGSMSGAPLGMCRSAMRAAIRKLRPVDTFNILTFAGSTQAAFATPRPANDAAIRQALAVVDEMSAGGGTHMADAVAAALQGEVAPGRHRYVFFMTDGYVGNEDEIIGASQSFVQRLEGRGQRARVFGFGVGSSVNRHLIDGLSRAGKGIGVYATTREDPARAVNRFFHYVDRAVMTGVEVAWAALGQQDVLPGRIPDLFASHPVVLHGRYVGKPSADLAVTGRVGEREVRLPVQVRMAPGGEEAGRLQGALWARAKVAALGEHLWDGNVLSVQEEITKLGIDFSLVTRFTSFVAVDTSRRVQGGPARTVVQPVHAPEGVDVEAAGGVRESPSLQVRPGPQRLAQHGQPGYGAPGPPPPAPASEEDEAGADYESYAEPDEGAYSVDSRRGCGCRVVGDGTRGGLGLGWWLAGLGLAGALARRHRWRRGAHHRRRRRRDGVGYDP